MGFTETEFDGRDSRGWSMRRGHCKRLKATCGGRESQRGRASFARSFGGNRRRDALWYPRGAKQSTLRFNDFQCDLKYQDWVGDEDVVGIFSEIAWDSAYWNESWRDCEIAWANDGESEHSDYDSQDVSECTVNAGRFENNLPQSTVLKRATSCPGTQREVDAATERSANAYVPLQAWSRSNLLRQPVCRLNRPQTRFDVAMELAAEKADLCDVINAWLQKRYRSRPRVKPNREETLGNFDRFRCDFLAKHEADLRKHLNPVLGNDVKFMPAPMNDGLANAFCKATQTGSMTVRPVYHGTKDVNYGSIFRQGLLIPAKNNGIKIANGSAQGVGIYTAELKTPQLSWSYSNCSRLLVCGFLDGGTAVSETIVKKVGAAIVIFQPSLVIPLYVAMRGNDTLPAVSSAVQAPAVSVTPATTPSTTSSTTSSVPASTGHPVTTHPDHTPVCRNVKDSSRMDKLIQYYRRRAARKRM